jgi:hypothetical protein
MVDANAHGRRSRPERFVHAVELLGGPLEIYPEQGFQARWHPIIGDHAIIEQRVGTVAGSRRCEQRAG